VSDLFDQTLAHTIKAISLWQPWATLIARGLKRHETRSWPSSHRGIVAIHAAKTIDMAGAPAALCHAGIGSGWWEDCPRGAIVAIARLRRCVSTDDVFQDLTRADEASGNYQAGRFAWELADVRPLDHAIPALGRQGLFNWSPPEDLDARLRAPVDHEAICAAIGWGR
jgi:hypothetical protein